MSGLTAYFSWPMQMWQRWRHRRIRRQMMAEFQEQHKDELQKTVEDLAALFRKKLEVLNLGNASEDEKLAALARTDNPELSALLETAISRYKKERDYKKMWDYAYYGRWLIDLLVILHMLIPFCALAHVAWHASQPRWHGRDGNDHATALAAPT